MCMAGQSLSAAEAMAPIHKGEVFSHAAEVGKSEIRGARVEPPEILHRCTVPLPVSSYGQVLWYLVKASEQAQLLQEDTMRRQGGPCEQPGAPQRFRPHQPVDGITAPSSSLE